ncbi:HDOD domain-containing protein [Oceaniserpentilla sp. 4NH20-0058]|uniref:HDOD domain-containing protein n=1 Tax=Oceaniserpentilla sp. 4NH20-0058 TaxID=3127660 RepID=UPI00310629F5
MNLADLFDHGQSLPNIPKVVQELIDTFNQADFDMDEIAKKISLDPVLTAKVLRLANCAHYGVSRTISSTTDASVLLGFSTLRTLVLASGITGAMQSPEGFDRKAFWSDNFAIAATAKWLAPYCKINPETAFTCGMLHSIGELLIRLVIPEESKKIQAAVEAGGKLVATENAMLGYNYADVGAELAKRWKFPEEIADGIRGHTKTEYSDDDEPLAGLTHLALYIHTSNKASLSAQEILDGFPVAIAKAINMDIDKVLSDLESTDGIESGMDTLLDDI